MSTMPNTQLKSFPIEFGGEELQLLHDCAVWWSAMETLFVADIHLGKAATFRAASIPIPDATATDLERLSNLFAVTNCRKLIVLGDLLHNKRGVTPELIEQVTNWRKLHEDINITLIRGNHDAYSGEIPNAWNIQVESKPLKLGSLTLRHQPMFEDDTPTLAGHLHPKYRLAVGNENLKLFCFALQSKTLVLPAFGTFVDGMVVRGNWQQFFVIADDEIYDMVPQKS